MTSTCDTRRRRTGRRGERESKREQTPRPVFSVVLCVYVCLIRRRTLSSMIDEHYAIICGLHRRYIRRNFSHLQLFDSGRTCCKHRLLIVDSRSSCSSAFTPFPAVLRRQKTWCTRDALRLDSCKFESMFKIDSRHGGQRENKIGRGVRDSYIKCGI